MSYTFFKFNTTKKLDYLYRGQYCLFSNEENQRKLFMIATRIHQRLESDTIRIPNASKFIGKDVEVIVLVEPSPDHPSDDNPRKRICGYVKVFVDKYSFSELIKNNLRKFAKSVDNFIL